MFHTSVEFAHSISPETASELVKLHLSDLPQHSFFTGRYPHLWRLHKSEYQRHEHKLLVTSKTESFDQEIESDGYTRLPAPSPEFHDAGSFYTRATWINVVQPGTDYRNQDIAVVFPSNIWEPSFPRFLSNNQATVTRPADRESARPRPTAYGAVLQALPNTVSTGLGARFRPRGYPGRLGQSRQARARLLVIAPHSQ